MSHYRLLPAVALGLSAALSGAACDDNGNGSTGLAAPSALGERPRVISRGNFTEPAAIDLPAADDPFCLRAAPILAPFGLVLGGDGIEGLILTGIDMHFVDGAGLRGASFSIAQPEIVTRFGTTSIPAFGTRRFPLSFPVGCAGFFPGTLNVVAVIADRDGRTSRRSFEIPVRRRTG
jgi:hypothetical protein